MSCLYAPLGLLLTILLCRGKFHLEGGGPHPLPLLHFLIYFSEICEFSCIYIIQFGGIAQVQEDLHPLVGFSKEVHSKDRVYGKGIIILMLK